MTKLLSDPEIDSCFSMLCRDFHAESTKLHLLKKVTAQAKLAAKIQKQAAEICTSEIGRVGQPYDYGRGAYVCREAILAMEIEP